MLEKDAQTQRDNFDAIVAAIKPMLDCVDLEPATQPDDRQQRLDTIIQRCKAVWENFKSFNRDAIVTATTHALVVVRSHYPAINIQAIGAGSPKG